MISYKDLVLFIENKDELRHLVLSRNPALAGNTRLECEDNYNYFEPGKTKCFIFSL